MSKVTYTNIVKFPWTQRLWKGSDDEYYLADESGDEMAYRGNPERFGRPDETHDGPLQIVHNEPLVATYGYGSDDENRPTGFKVAVRKMREEWEHCHISICADGAFYLAQLLGMTVVTKHGSYTVGKGSIDV